MGCQPCDGRDSLSSRDDLAQAGGAVTVPRARTCCVASAPPVTVAAMASTGGHRTSNCSPSNKRTTRRHATATRRRTGRFRAHQVIGCSDPIVASLLLSRRTARPGDRSHERVSDAPFPGPDLPTGGRAPGSSTQWKRAVDEPNCGGARAARQRTPRRLAGRPSVVRRSHQVPEPPYILNS
jgi:hypothetical protein